MLESRVEITQRRLGIKVSPFPQGTDGFFLDADQSRPVKIVDNSPSFVPAEVTKIEIEGKPVILVCSDFEVNAETDLDVYEQGHVFMRQWVYKGYKSRGETWTARISTDNIRKDLKLADKQKIPVSDEEVLLDPPDQKPKRKARLPKMLKGDE